MTEHKHEYTVGVRWIDGHDADGIEHTIPIAYAKCACGHELEYFEIERRLNAYDAMREYIIEEVGIEYVPKEWGGKLE